ncbi:MAG: hypothetical protein LBQ01_04390 [Prevotellaceae bacterium]|jgi:hypothetical protein|nr:hypothetical protein [Prevotellaceae bacterium]
MSIFNPFRKLEQPETVLLHSGFRQSLTSGQIVYVENKYHHKFNRFIRQNYAVIEQKFKAKGFDFIYFPIIGEDFSRSDNILQIEPLLNYCYPFMNNRFGYFSSKYIAEHLPESLKITTDSKTRKLFAALKYNKKILPGLLRLVSEDDETCFTFEYRRLDLSKKNGYWRQITDYLATLEDVSSSIINFSVKYDANIPGNGHVSDENDVFADLESSFVHESRIKTTKAAPDDYMLRKEVPHPAFSRKMLRRRAANIRYDLAEDFYQPKHDIVEKILGHINEAKSLGIYEEVIQDIFAALKNPDEKDDVVKISRIVIDSDYRIFLPDYGSMEICMTTLPKSLFILFLRHPEGIILKHLSDCKQELLQIYKTISNRTDLIFMSDSIERLCNPADSSINEKLSRIREAFIRKMSGSNASNYCVTGPRGEKKRIALNRELVSMPKVLTDII